MGRPRLAALVRGGRRNPDPGRAPPASSPPSRAGADCGTGASGVAGRARAAGPAPPATRRSARSRRPPPCAPARRPRRRRRDHRRRHARHRSAARPSLRLHPARRPPRQPRRPACRGAGDVARHGPDGARSALGSVRSRPDRRRRIGRGGRHRHGCLDSHRLPRRRRRALRRHARRPAVAPAPIRRRRRGRLRPARPGRPRPPSGHHASRRPASGVGLRLAWPAALSPPPARGAR